MLDLTVEWLPNLAYVEFVAKVRPVREARRVPNNRDKGRRVRGARGGDSPAGIVDEVVTTTPALSVQPPSES